MTGLANEILSLCEAEAIDTFLGLIKAKTEDGLLLKKLIKQKKFGEFADFLAFKWGFNSEKMRDVLDKKKISDSEKQIEFMIKLISTSAGIKKFQNFKGY